MSLKGGLGFGLWPFWLFVAGMLAALCWVSLHWADIMWYSVIWQKQLHQQMAVLLRQVALDPRSAGGALVLFSLSYGVLHAVGPGHGKVVITTYLATHPSRLRTSLGMTLAASVLQGLMAIALVSIVLVALRLSTRHLHLGALWLEKGGFALMAILGLLICRRAAGALWRAASKRPTSRQVVPLRPASGHDAPAPWLSTDDATVRPVFYAAHPVSRGNERLKVDAAHPSRPVATHPDDCGCGHHHIPDEAQLRAADNWRTRAAVVVTMGVRPCSGAVLVLLFAKVLGVYFWGVVSALVMAAGTALTLLALSLLVYFARHYAERLTRRYARPRAMEIAWAGLAMAGGVALVAAGVVMYLAARPELVGGGNIPFSH